jgi:hypothetical protein
MKKSKKQSVKTIVFMFIFSTALISTYLFIRTRTNPIAGSYASSMSEAEKLLSKDISGSYPSSPREVLKLYSRITKVLFNENLKPEQIEKLADQLHLLFDDELLKKNPMDNYILDLNVEITDYRKAKRTIMNYVIDESSAVKYWEKEEKKYASLVVSYTTKEASNYSKVYENFLLRQDAQEKWKIMGWEITDKKDLDTQE